MFSRLRDRFMFWFMRQVASAVKEELLAHAARTAKERLEVIDCFLHHTGAVTWQLNQHVGPQDTTAFSEAKVRYMAKKGPIQKCTKSNPAILLANGHYLTETVEGQGIDSVPTMTVINMPARQVYYTH